MYPNWIQNVLDFHEALVELKCLRNKLEQYPQLYRSWIQTTMLSGCYALFSDGTHVPFSFHPASCHEDCSKCKDKFCYLSPKVKGKNGVSTALNVHGLMQFPILIFCQHIRNEVALSYTNTKFDDEREAYPAMAVACRKHGDWIIERDYTGTSDCGNPSTVLVAKNTDAKNFCEKLSSALTNRTQSQIGKKTASCNNPVGHCAEPHAANKVMVRTNCDVDDLEFSLAVRPRTLVAHDYCNNCKTVFPFCNNNPII